MHAPEAGDLEARVARIEHLLDERRRVEEEADELDQDAWWLLRELDRRQPGSALVYGGLVPPSAGGPVRWQISHDPETVLATDWASSAAALAALGHPSRLQILQLVARGQARTAAELTGADGLGTTGQVYHHLRLLVAAGWLAPGVRGQHHVPAERLVPLLVVLSASGAAG